MSTNRWSLRNGIGGRRRLDGIGDSTPVRDWKLLAAGDSAGGSGYQVSARKLAAELWRSCSITDIGGSYGLLSGRKFELCPSLQNTKFETEGITKWDICYSEAFDLSLKRSKEIAAIASAGQTANEFGAEGGLRKKINYSIKKLDEERASRTKSEHPKVVRPIIKNLAEDIKREREKCKKMDRVNSKLLSDIVRTKSWTRKLVQSLEREGKARKLFECVCDELAKIVEGSKGEIVELRNQRKRFQDEVEDERKMMQIAEAWREEEAQMKLVEAKLMLEDKFSEMNSLIADAKEFSRPDSDSTTKSVVMSKAKAKAAVPSQQTVQGAVDKHTNPHVVRAMKGHIIWPRGIQRHSSAAKHLEAKLESQRMLMRNVLKQRC